jgi:DNA end-binding protein Ku
MARAIWSGSISFGLVSVPVKVLAAVKEHTVHFHQVDKKSGSRIRYEKVAEKSGKEVSSSDIELGYEKDNGDMVVMESSELDELRPESSRTIDIADFVELSSIQSSTLIRTGLRLTVRRLFVPIVFSSPLWGVRSVLGSAWW